MNLKNSFITSKQKDRFSQDKAHNVFFLHFKTVLHFAV